MGGKMPICLWEEAFLPKVFHRVQDAIVLQIVEIRLWMGEGQGAAQADHFQLYSLESTVYVRNEYVWCTYTSKAW